MKAARHARVQLELPPKPLSSSEGNLENVVTIGSKEFMSENSELQDSGRRGNVEELLTVAAQYALIPRGSETTNEY